jgi:hypothetical protein
VIGIATLKTIIRPLNLDTGLIGYNGSHKTLPTLQTTFQTKSLKVCIMKRLRLEALFYIM